ncbi:MAG: TldD/PmbA family protein [Fibrobacteria bacterium]|nr:TldD/PmbA family protein [Fibrobacteria bacterium]
MSDTPLSPADALQLALDTAKSLGVGQCDAIYAEDDSLSLDLFEGRVKSLERSDSTGLGLRVLVEGRPGYSFTERLTRPAIERVARDAVALAAFTDALPIELPAPEEVPGIDLEQWSESVDTFDPETMRNLLLEAEAAARQADGRIENVPHLGCSRSRGTTLLANSRGLFSQRRSGSVSMGVGVVAKTGEVSKMGWDGLTLRTTGGFDPGAMARQAVQRATSLLGAGPVPAGTLPILFDRHVAGSFLSLFLSSFLADSVQKGQSRLAGRVGEDIARRGFHLGTRPHLKGMSGSRLRDGEGIPTADRNLIEDGKLLGFLHNLETAARDGIRPTGDASRGYSGRVGAGFSNAVVPLEGGLPREQLLGAHPRLLHVVKLDGSTGCNAVSGEISIGVQGHLVENGRSVRPVDRITLSGNFLDFLKDLEAWGDSWKPGVQSVLVPDLLVKGLAIAS